jgi:hypothetical protein
MKTQTKTEVRNNTAKAAKLLRGIDNEVAAINKETAALNKRTAVVKQAAAQAMTLLTGLSGTALVGAGATAAKPASKPAPKPAKKTAKKAAAKPAKKAAAKPAAKPAKKAAAKAAAPKPAKKAAAKPAPKPAKPGERPALFGVVVDVLNKTPDVTAAAIYKTIESMGLHYSRQSLYNQLEKPAFTKAGDGATATFRNAPGQAKAAAPAAKTSDADADAFVEKATANPATVAAS